MGARALWAGALLLSACMLVRGGMRTEDDGPSADGDVDADGDGDADADGDGDGDADGCVPSAETCNGVDDDCDGDVDEDFDLDTDLDNCGACGHACPADPPHAASRCESGDCRLACDAGWGDCDLAAAGCETSLATPSDCGACGRRCGGATPLCAPDGSGGYECVSSCEPPEEDCAGTCTDTSTDPENCGACGRACAEPAHARPTCTAASCGYECDADWHDCSGSAADGCESDLRTLTDCGACGVPCDLPHATESCATGSCEVVACEGLWRDCSAAPGCETEATTTTDCGACGVPCDLPHATESCATGSCEIVHCEDGWEDCTSAPGCESDLHDEATCTDCTTVCDPGETCTGTGCVGECPPPCVCSTDCDPSCSCASGCPCTDYWCRGNCDITCSGSGTSCEVDAAGASNVYVSCNGGASCEVDFTGGSNMYSPPAHCSGGGTSCYFDCTSASHCHVRCDGGAHCVVDCSSSGDCEFSYCEGVPTDCGSDVWACGGPCP